jgi:hypothetical protein
MRIADAAASDPATGSSTSAKAVTPTWTFVERSVLRSRLDPARGGRATAAIA